MFHVNRFIDLTGFKGDRADYLVELMQSSPYPVFAINVNKEGTESVSCEGSRVRGVSIHRLMNDPIINDMVSNRHSKEQIAAFIRGILSKTLQTIFKTYSKKLNNQWMTSVQTDVIDWEKTIGRIIRKFPGRIKIDDGDSDYEKTILKIDDVEYQVRIDLMGLNPTDEEVCRCEKHVLSIFSEGDSSM